MSAILAALRPQANAAKAAEMAAYHKTDREILGVGNPAINDAVAAFRAAHPIEAWPEEAAALWASGVFEARIAAGKLLIKARLNPAQDQAFWALITGWVSEFDGWAIADSVANAGERRVMADLSRLDALQAWTTADHLWTRRAALVFTLPLAKLPHPDAAQAAGRERVLGWAADYTADREWFIQKAIAWWLRTLSTHDPARVRGFLAEHGPRMKVFARKDAARKLPPDA